MLHIHTKMGFRNHFKEKAISEVMVFQMCQGWSPAVLPPGLALSPAFHTIPHPSSLYFLMMCKTQEVTGVLSNYYNIKIGVMWHSG